MFISKSMALALIAVFLLAVSALGFADKTEEMLKSVSPTTVETTTPDGDHAKMNHNSVRNKSRAKKAGDCVASHEKDESEHAKDGREQADCAM